ncbi:hypothetical protein [Pseudomonas yamanorum]|jgi:hypothetical protein
MRTLVASWTAYRAGDFSYLPNRILKFSLLILEMGLALTILNTEVFFGGGEVSAHKKADAVHRLFVLRHGPQVTLTR